MVAIASRWGVLIRLRRPGCTEVGPGWKGPPIWQQVYMWGCGVSGYAWDQGRICAQAPVSLSGTPRAMQCASSTGNLGSAGATWMRRPCPGGGGVERGPEGPIAQVPSEARGLYTFCTRNPLKSRRCS